MVQADAVEASSPDEKPCCTEAELGAACAEIARTSPNNPSTSDFYLTCNLPKRFEHPSWFYGYGIQRRPTDHPCYRTTTSDYGRFPPSVHSVPSCFYPRDQQFSKKLLLAGNYRNYSLNTSMK